LGLFNVSFNPNDAVLSSRNLTVKPPLALQWQLMIGFIQPSGSKIPCPCLNFLGVMLRLNENSKPQQEEEIQAGLVCESLFSNFSTSKN
jgi:hypothetical protein